MPSDSATKSFTGVSNCFKNFTTPKHTSSTVKKYLVFFGNNKLRRKVSSFPLLFCLSHTAAGLRGHFLYKSWLVLQGDGIVFDGHKVR